MEPVMKVCKKQQRTRQQGMEQEYLGARKESMQGKQQGNTQEYMPESKQGFCQ